MAYKPYPRYKDSKIEWLGDIPEHWIVRKLKFIGDAIIGLTYSPNDVGNENDGILVLRSSNIQDGQLVNKDNVYVSVTVSEKLTTKLGDIIVCSRNGSRHLIGKNAQVTKEFANQTFGAFTTLVRSDINDFLYFVFNSQLFEFQSGMYLTSTINQLTMGAFNSFEIPEPPIKEQQQIITFLEFKTRHLDALIAKKQELIDQLELQRTAIITKAVTKGLDDNVKMKDSGVEWLGKVPEHWDVRRLKFLTNTSLQYGANEAAVLSDRDQPRFIRITDVMDDGTLNEDSFRSLPEDVAEPFLLEDGDILLARSGATVGKSFKYESHWGKAAYAGYLIRFKVNKAILDEDFAYYFFQSEIYWANIESTLIQATIQNFSAEKYANVSLPLPPPKEQNEIVSYLSNQLTKLNNAKTANQTMIEHLQEYRTAIITAAVTGKIDVRDIELP